MKSFFVAVFVLVLYFMFPNLSFAQKKCDVSSKDFKTKINLFGQLFSDEYGSETVNQDQGRAAIDLVDIKLQCETVFKEKNIDDCFKNIFQFSKEIQKIYSRLISKSNFDMTEICPISS